MKLRFRTGFVAALCAAVPAAATPLYSQNFEVDSTASWTLNGGPSDEAADFFFDYSTVGIPSAPNGAGTRGMKLQANLTNGIFGGMSVSPTGLNVVPSTDDYKVEFDWWNNFNGPFPGGGSGSTNMSTFGVGTAGITPQWPGGVQDSVWFAATGDGGSASDWRAYSTAAPTGYASGNAVYPHTSNNNTNAYFAAFGGLAAPAAQLALYPQQTGLTAVGTSGMAWHRVTIEKVGNSLTWHVNGVLMATIDTNTVTMAGGNIFFGHTDINATSSTDPNDVHLLFTLIDNITVTPEPSSLALLGLAAFVARRRGR
ncbi:MAG: PEP-CTERM sorting domain-containing protein [Planctomycetia bacterium]|nr:MAG: PEP-CTERM sorting domain-containing protein [Planctomycetia bacterium]